VSNSSSLSESTIVFLIRSRT